MIDVRLVADLEGPHMLRLPFLVDVWLLHDVPGGGQPAPVGLLLNAGINCLLRHLYSIWIAFYFD